MGNLEFLNRLEHKISGQIDFVVKYIQNMPEDELLKRPSAHSWSVAECLEHLNSYGNYYLPLVRQKVILSENSRGLLDYRPSWMGLYISHLITPKSKSIKFKARTKHLPVVVSCSHTVIDHINQQEELLQLVRRSVGMDLTRNKIPVSVFKPIALPLGDIYGFLVLHTTRHLVQANKISNFPLQF